MAQPQPMRADEVQRALANFIDPTNTLLERIVAALEGNRPDEGGRRRDLDFDAEIPDERIVQGLDVLDLRVQNMRAGIDSISNQVKSVSDYMNPYLQYDRDGLLAILKEKGMQSLQVLVGTVPESVEIVRKRLNLVDEIPDLADQILKYNNGENTFADQGFERKAFDLFVKTNKTNPRGIPLDQTFRYLPKSIPEAHVKFDGKLYNLIQGGTKIAMKNYKAIERIALQGGTYSEELKLLRKIRSDMETEKPNHNIIFKSRKI